MNIWTKIWWMLFGMWILSTVVFVLEARREEGGAMPIAVVLIGPWIIGGAIVFLLAHILVRKISKESDPEDHDET